MITEEAEPSLPARLGEGRNSHLSMPNLPNTRETYFIGFIIVYVLKSILAYLENLSTKKITIYLKLAKY